jgi:glutamine synthetase
MMEGLEATNSIEGSAYDTPFELHRHIYSAIEAMKRSDAMRKTLGDSFVTLYCLLKEDEEREFEEIITPWEREILMFNV